MRWFIGLLIVKAMYKESFFVHQAMEDQRLLHKLRFQLSEDLLPVEREFKYIDQVEVLLKKLSVGRANKRPYIGSYILRRCCAIDTHLLLSCPSLTLSLQNIIYEVSGSGPTIFSNL